MLERIRKILWEDRVGLMPLTGGHTVELFRGERRYPAQRIHPPVKFVNSRFRLRAGCVGLREYTTLHDPIHTGLDGRFGFF